MTETPLFFVSGGYSLFAVLHRPEAPVVEKSPFVFCHPLAEEKLWTHRVFVSYARHLAAEGHPVIRFDYMGNGDSDGEFEECSVTTVLADVRAAIGQVQQMTGAGRVNLLGLRFGATIASLAAEQGDLPVERLILWSPVVDGARYMQELLRTNLTTQLATHKEVLHDREALVGMMQQGSTVNVDGYDMALPLYREASAVRLAAEPKRHPGPCLVVQVDRPTARPSAELQRLAASYSSGTFVSVAEEPFWKEIARFYERAPNLFAATSAWLGLQS